jgi:hypothetical protein
MTGDELAIQTNKLRLNEEQALRAIADYARTLIPLLRDKGLEHVARELEAKLFTYDTHQTETADYCKKNAREILLLLLRGGA